MTAMPSRPAEPQFVHQHCPDQSQRSLNHTEIMQRVRNRRTIAHGIGFLLLGPLAVHILSKRATHASEWLAVAVLATGVVLVLLWSLRESFTWKLPRSVGSTPPRWFESLERKVDPERDLPQTDGKLYDRWLDG
jgi:hypothetical protein